LKHFNIPNEKEDLIDLVKKALNNAQLLDFLEVNETNEGYLLKPKPGEKNKMIKTFESLSGSATTVGEDVKELIKMADRKEGWRENTDE
jgi:hypothetical protein